MRPAAIFSSPNHSLTEDFSDDGKFFFFTSNAKEFLQGYIPTNPIFVNGVAQRDYANNLFVKNLANGQISLLSKDQSGNEIVKDGSIIIDAISPSGRYVAFETSADNFVPGDVDHHFDVFIRDIDQGTISRIGPVNGGNFSADGRYFTYVDANNQLQIYDVWARTSEPLSVTYDGASPNGFTGKALISHDGSYVSFISAATNIVPDDTDGKTDLFLKDLRSGEISLVQQGLDSSFFGKLDSYSVSDDARYFVFGDGFQSFVKDTANGQTAELGVTDNSHIAGGSGIISGSGSVIAFTEYRNDGSSTVDLVAFANPLYAQTANFAPHVTTSDQQITATYTVSAASLFRATDRDGNETITAYEFQDNGNTAGSGHFSINGVTQGNAPFQVSAADVSQVRYTAGLEGTVDPVTIRAFDGNSWSNLSSFQASAVPLIVSELRKENSFPGLDRSQ